MELGVSKEDYLKVIYQLTKQYGSARVNRIAEELNYTPASIICGGQQAGSTGICAEKP